MGDIESQLASSLSMAIARVSSSALLAVVLIVLAGIFIMPNVPVSYLPKEGSSGRPLAQSGAQPDFQMQIEPNQFLMRNDTTANPGLVFTPLNGFVGNVTLRAIVSPIEHSAPTVSLNPSTVKLNASLPGSPLYPMLVTTNMTESGLYTITVTGSSASISHSATATVGVTGVFVPANGADLVYKAHFTGVAYVGGSTVLDNSFSDLGYAPIGIANLRVSLPFGTYTFPPACTATLQEPCVYTSSYLSLNPYDEKTTALTIQIPDTISAGNYTVTATVSWVLNPGGIYEKPASDLVAHGYLIVYSNSPNPAPRPPLSLSSLAGAFNGLFRFMIAVLGGSAIAILIVGLVVLNNRTKRRAFERLSDLTLFCAHCGTPAVSGTKSCGRCGYPIP